MPDSPGSKALRHGRFSQAGQIYLVTTVTNHRVRLFDDLAAARIVVNALRHYHEKAAARCWAYVLMPDHLHWLLELDNGMQLPRLLRSLKTFTARQINRIAATPGGVVWQPGYHDHAVRKEEDLRRLAQYTIENPIRAGLVERVGDYPYWDAWWFQPDKKCPMESALDGLSD